MLKNRLYLSIDILENILDLKNKSYNLGVFTASKKHIIFIY